MKVAHLIKATRIAGAERHLLILLPGLQARGVEVRLLLLVEPDKPVQDFGDALVRGGIPVERIVIHRHSDIGVIGRIRAALLQDKPDLLHTHLIHADLFGAAAGRLAGVPHRVISRHNDDPFRRRLALRLMNRLLWGMSDAGIAISEAIRRFCIEVEGAPPAKIQTIHYGLPPTPSNDFNQRRADLRRTLNLPSDALIAGVVCRLIEQKGVTYALKAFARLVERHPSAHLVIVGDGALRADLEAEAGMLGIAGRAHFLGWRDDAAQVMAGFDVLLMPSLWEGFGIVMLEAMAAAVPIIGSDVSAIPEVVVYNENGYLVPPRDAEALAEALDALFSDTPLRRHMGLLGQERLETVFGADRMVEATAALYDRLMA
ncbi:MAG: glycosyltransferase [Anaerolineae bacterium]|nr:glycosyltransferase [Anaerolineae bacterium]NUQ06254.1 glycosyltransferase [Anaerolineae bacterium]